MGASAPAKVDGKKAAFLARFGVALVWIGLALGLLWSTAALYFDFPLPLWRAPAATVYSVLIALLIWREIRHPGRLMMLLAVLAFAVMAWWSSLEPSNDRPWQKDVTHTAWASIENDTVTIRNVRNFEYRTETDYQPRWETRTVRISELRHADFYVVSWGVPGIAHTILSFDFGDGNPLAFSVETRKEVGEEYSAVRGFFRQFELIYVVADERDVVRLRTNFRKDEEAYLYRLNVTPERVRQTFLEIIGHVNRLHQNPEWYNALTSNCTTSLTRDLASSGGTRLWDIRVLLNDRLDEAAYELGKIAGDVPKSELRQRAHINPVARQAPIEDFSRAIRAGRPGF